MIKDHFGDLLGIAGNELDDIRWQASFEEDVVNEPIRGHGAGRRLPKYDVAHECGCCWEIPRDGCEVERCDCVYESFQWSVLNATSSNIRDEICLDQIW